MTKLRTVLLTLVGGLVGLGCVDEYESSAHDLPLSKVCGLADPPRLPALAECQQLCGDDDVDACNLAVPGPKSVVELCAPASAKTDPTVVKNALVCTTKSSKLGNPFAEREESTGNGRRPEGFVRPAMTVSDLGSFFAACHELEAVSVDAFERLARELAAFGAPAALVGRAHEAKRDEIRHARWTAVLARKHGSEPCSVAPAPLSVRSLFDMALENAIEGVVRETYGAASALYSAHTIDDARIRRVMKRIAEDEIRHAELSWDIAVFAAGRLEASERHSIRREMEKALATLECFAEDESVVRSQAGLPDRRAATAIVARLGELLAAADFCGFFGERLAA